MHVQRLTHVRGRSFPCCGLVGLILVIRRSMAYPPLSRQSLPMPGSVRACGRRLSHPASSFKKTKISLELPAKMLLAAFKKRKQNRYTRAQARKEGLQQTRGHWTTRRQLPTASTNAHRRAGDSCMAGTLVFRGRLLEFSPSTLRRSGAGGREGALVSARCKGCSYDAECSANHTADVYTLLCATHRSLRKK